MSRLCLTIGCLLVLVILGRQHETPPPTAAASMAMAGFCSGDCDSCGCPPALAASGNCCCTRTRQLRHPELRPTLAVTAGPESAGPRPPSLRCSPCNRDPAALSEVGGKLVPLLAAAMTVPPLPCLVRHTEFPDLLHHSGRGAAAPPSPPPEVPG